jgi:molybdate transport system substrate-binding protein
MKTSIELVAAAGLAATLLSSQADIANAAEIKVLSAIGIREVMEDLRPKFERISGHKLAITFATMGGVVKRVQDGEAADLVIIPRPGIDSIVKDGKAAPADVIVVASAGISVVVRKGASKPDISSPEALKRTLLAAKSITYTNPAAGGASGIHFAKVLERLGIANNVKAKTVFGQGGNTGIVVANGEAEIGVAQLPTLISVAGIEVVGPLPGDLQDTAVFAAAIMAGAHNAEAAKALVDFLRTPEAAAVIKTKGMEPEGST